MTITNLSELNLEGETLAAWASSQGGVSSASGSAIGYQTLQPSPTSGLSGRAVGTGPEIRTRRLVKSPTPIPVTTSSPISFYPKTEDSFTELTNGTNTIVTPTQFNLPISAINAVESYIFRIIRYAPIDLATRLNSGSRRLF